METGRWGGLTGPLTETEMETEMAKKTSKTASKTRLIPKVRSLQELGILAVGSPSYLQLAICGVENLGGSVPQVDGMVPGDAAYKTAVNTAMRQLTRMADETSEQGVVAEVNFVRDCVK